VIGVSSRSAPEKYLEDVAKLRGNPRVWFLFSHVCDWCQASEEVYILGYLDQNGKRLDSTQASGTSGYLYDLIRH
jgi:hypothetical protein